MFDSLATSLKLPDLWQHQAVDHLRSGRDVVVDAPTGAGKTYVFELLHESKHFHRQCVYTVPTRALANDKYAEWKARKWDVGIATGDLSENVHAPVLVATLETQIERLLRGDGPDCLVIDEYQMIADEARGAHYEGAVALAPLETRLLLLSGSVENPHEVVMWMRRLGRQAEVVATKQRPVPLDEMPVESLPGHRGQRFEGWWPKLVSAVISADLAPLLIFSPKRKSAEQIARSLAAELPMGEPLSLTEDQRRVCGKELSALIEHRVAYHHSGLSYAARAGVIEPLAKAGQLRCIVATMGLAAGINFSVRSVHVASTKFHDGRQEQLLAPDDLLQMFGRAGRRGLDERGYVITVREGSSLHDARPARLHRSSLLAWPMFLRVMKHAALRNDSPFEAAGRFAARLFAKVPPLLGFEEAGPPQDSPLQRVSIRDGKAIFGLDPTEDQILNSEGKWETLHPQRQHQVSLGQAWVADEERQGPALANAYYVGTLGKGVARVCRLHNAYGLEVALGVPVTETVFKPTKTLRKLLKLGASVPDMSLDEFTRKHRQKIARRLMPSFSDDTKDHFVAASDMPRFLDYTEREGLRMARFDMSGVPVPTYTDNHGKPLIAPRQRTVKRESPTAIKLSSDDNARPVSPRPGSPVHAWRSLGLIDADGVPTLRGEIVSFFQHGEGLAIAAALEDESYAVEDLVHHMANLRAGQRFELDGAFDSERLGAVCRHTYGFVNHHGYLVNGLPTDYGDGACEVIEALLARDRRAIRQVEALFSEGDLSRCYVEWLSLIRHVANAPNHEWQRWRDLQDACERALKHHSKSLRHLFHLELPPLTAKQLQTKMKHILLPRHHG